MSIDYINRTNYMTIECDICQSTDEYEGTFVECIEQAKKDGWKIILREDDYYHFCSNECLRKL